MDKKKREIIALVLLVVLLVAGLGFFGWYIVTGHKWNVAATTIDDMTGSMDGYVVLIYEGTDTPDSESVKNAEAETDIAAASASVLADTRKSYREKGATVFSLRTGTYSYTEPFVLLRNGYRVGFVPVEKDTPYLTIDRQIALLQQRGADIVVALEYSENEYLETVSGVDVILELGVTPTEQAEADASDLTESAQKDAGQATGSASGEDISVKAGSSSASASASSGAEASASAQDAVPVFDSSSSSTAESTAASSEASPAQTTTRHRKSDALIVSRCDRGLVSVVLVSPNNIVSSKTIAAG